MSLFLGVKKYCKYGMFGLALVVSVALSMLMSDKAFAKDGSTVASRGDVYYDGTSVNVVLTFDTYRYGDQPYCDGTSASAYKGTSNWNNPISWDTLPQPSWSKWQGYYIYDIYAKIVNSAGHDVTGSVNFGTLKLNGGSASTSRSINVSGLAPGTYRLVYNYNRNHFCESVGNIDAPGSVTFTIPNPLPNGSFDQATCTLVTGWSYDRANPSVANDVHLYFSADPVKAHPAYYADPAVFSVNNTNNNRVLRPDVVAAFGSPPLSSSQKYGFEYNPMNESWFTNRAGSKFYVTMWAIGALGNPQIGPQLSFGPCYDYNLTPRVSVDNAGREKNAQAGDKIKFNYYMDSVGSTVSQGTWWTSRIFVVPAGVSYSPGSLGVIFDQGTPGNNNNIPASVRSPLPGCSNGGDCVLTYTSGTVFQSGSDNRTKLNMTKYGNYGYNSDMVNGDIDIDLNGLSLNIGDRVCTVLEVAPRDGIASMGRHAQSAPACVTITKSPQLQIRGADSRSGAKYWGDEKTAIDKSGGFVGTKFPTTGNPNNPKRGSWSQYGILATGSSTVASNSGAEIKGFGSAGYTFSQANTCKLIFANASANSGNGGGNCGISASDVSKFGQFGDLNRTISLPDEAKVAFNELEADDVPLVAATNCGSLGNASTGCTVLDYSGVYKHNGNLTIRPATPAPGTRLTVVVNGDVYIFGAVWNGNIKNTPYGDLGQIPSLTIIANNIFVYNGGTPTNNLYGTYITGATGDGTGTFYSCGISSGGKLNPPGTNESAQLGVSGACSPSALTIDGALVTKNSPRFQRTYGGDADAPLATTPAEVINYTPNLFLTPAYNDTELDSDTTWKTMTQRSLPARF